MDITLVSMIRPQHFAAVLVDLDLKFPLRVSREEIGGVVDDEGEDVFIVDIDAAEDDDRVIQLTLGIVGVLNTAAGYRLVATGDKAEPTRWEPTTDCPLPAAPGSKPGQASGAGGAA